MKNENIDDQLLDLKEVLCKIRISKSLLYKKMKNDEFPKPLKIGIRSLWPLSCVQEYVSELKRTKVA